ncbi:MAG: hypothetical protein Q8930_11440 [Bacillota bacterium]|nr:hypothetical protein [Bacillota bacterium]
MKKKFIFLSLAVILIGVSIGSFALLKTPVSYLSIDINPSVELGVNVLNKVVSAKGYNNDGEIILNGKDLVSSTVSEAVNTLIKSASEKGFIADDGSTVVSVTSETDNQNVAAQLTSYAVDGAMSAVKEKGETITLLKNSVPLASREKAEKLSLTAGKLNIIEKLQALDPSVTIDEYKDAKITDIVNKIKYLEDNSNAASSSTTTEINPPSSTSTSENITSNSSTSLKEVTPTKVNDTKTDEKKTESKTEENSEVLPVEQLPISLYSSETDVTFKNGNWGSITAAISKEGIGGTNCIKYENLLKNPYSPGPTIVLPRAKNVTNVKPTDKLQLKMDIGTVTDSQPVKIIFNGDPNISLITPKLNRTSGFEIVTLDISNILDKLNGRISKLSFDGAGPNGWQGVNYLLVDDISIISPAEAAEGNSVEPVQPAPVKEETLPLMIYNHTDNVTFCPPHWGSIKAEVVKMGETNQNYISFSNLKNNVYAPTPDIVFQSPKNISGISSSVSLKLSLNIGETRYPQAIKLIINGSEETSVVTPKIQSSSAMQDIYVDISAIKNKLGGQIAQIAVESAAPNGFANVDSLYIGEISIVKSPADEPTNQNYTSTR